MSHETVRDMEIQMAKSLIYVSLLFPNQAISTKCTGVSNFYENNDLSIW